MSDTPRTDAVLANYMTEDLQAHARQLERELAEAKSRLDNVPALLENNAKLRRELADAKKETTNE